MPNTIQSKKYHPTKKTTKPGNTTHKKMQTRTKQAVPVAELYPQELHTWHIDLHHVRVPTTYTDRDPYLFTTCP